jgi:SAM-dependent methyltransferase
MSDSTKRLSSRVENYVKYRPGYPAPVIDLLRRECDLSPASQVADIGSGTGILTEMLLKSDGQIFAVEPNQEMRMAAERLLSANSNFHSVNGTAEATTLRPQSMDVIVAAQAFHWFDRARTRPEFTRILKPGGRVVLIWNDRRTDSTPFLQAYEKLLQEFSLDYRAVDHKQIDAATIGAFFAPNVFKSASFENRQVFDFEGLKGRLLSSSYAPELGHPKHEPMLRELSTIFEQHARQNQIVFEYDTLMYYGRLD